MTASTGPAAPVKASCLTVSLPQESHSSCTKATARIWAASNRNTDAKRLKRKKDLLPHIQRTLRKPQLQMWKFSCPASLPRGVGTSAPSQVAMTHEAFTNCLLCANYCCCCYYYRSTSQDPPGTPIRFFLIIPVLGEKTQVNKCK